ncbi:ankyrin repeat domain-containing protein [Vibrio fluvialis]|uniref:ankyrin repeat domain-containing protein n=1 Tax=Vibrio fluvialis TaxID=676 RepID=UPI00301E5F6E
MTSQKIATPYYTIQYLLREFANGLGTKGIDPDIAKKIDDACKNNEVTPAVYDELKHKLIYEPLKGFVNESIAKRFVTGFDNFIEQYRELMQVAPLDGVSTDDGHAFLERHFLTFTIALFCDEMLGDVSINSRVVAQSGQSFVSIVVNGIKRMPQWPEHYKKLSAETKERLRVWSLTEGAELPSIKSINLIGQKFRPEQLWRALKVYFLIARLWDYFFKQFPQMDVSLLYAVAPQDLDVFYRQALAAVLKKAGQKHQRSIPLALELDNKLRLRKSKTSDSEESCRILFGRLKYESEADVNHESTYFCHWMKARLELQSGHLELAIEEYEQAFEQVIYRQGENTVCIIREALIAACRMPKPYKPFINRLRRMAAMFNIDLMPDGPVNETTKKKALDIEDWEIAAFARMFDSYFTKESFFPNANYPENPHKTVGMWFADDDDFAVDLKKPDKKLKVGKFGGLEKKMPQLTYFSMTHNSKAVSELLGKGADVNQLSSSNESALLFAVQEMQVNLCPINTMQDDNFWMLAEHEHTVKTLDTVTTKRKLTPLGCGVQTGRLDVVQKLVDMGATVERRHDTGNETPLFTAIGLISRHTRTEINTLHTELMQDSEMNLKSLRAHGAGLFPHDTGLLKSTFNELREEESYQYAREQQLKYEKEMFERYSTAQGFRDIAQYLIEQGANPNAKHNTALEGYTPLMLAVELDEVELVHAMLQSTLHKGDLSDTCFYPAANLRAGLFEIACKWNSKKVLKSLLPQLKEHALYR